MNHKVAWLQSEFPPPNQHSKVNKKTQGARTATLEQQLHHYDYPTGITVNIRANS